MSKKRKLIRKEVVGLLKKKRISRVDDKVYTCHSAPNWHENLPAIDVYVRSEEAAEYAQAPRDLKRTMQLVIEITAAEPTDDKTADLLDDISDDVERILSADDTLGGTVEDHILRSTEFEFKGESESPVFSTRLIYDMIYLTAAPETRIDQNIVDLDKVDITWNVASTIPEGAEDKLDIP